MIFLRCVHVTYDFGLGFQTFQKWFIVYNIGFISFQGEGSLRATGSSYSHLYDVFGNVCVRLTTFTSFAIHFLKTSYNIVLY